MNTAWRVAALAAKVTLLICILAFCLAATLTAQSIAAPPVKHIAYTQQSLRSVDSLALDARVTRVENAACLTSYAVVADTLFIGAIAPATYVSADSVSIYAFAPVCPSGVPTIHSHVAYEGWPQPSDIDLGTEKLVGMWSLLLSVVSDGWRIIIY